MSERIPQSVSKLVVFRALLASDGKTPATGKTIAITISKNGATAFSNPAAGATNATEMASGFYKFTLGTGDADTQGPLAWRGAEGTINDAGDVYEVVNAFNAGFTGVPGVIAEGAGGLFTRGTGAGQINQTTNGTINVLLTAAGVQAIWDALTSALTTVGSVGKWLLDNVAPTATENADALLARDIGSGTGAGTLDERTVRAALRFLRNKWTLALGTLTVTKEDDTATAWTAAMTTNASSDPITGSDPT